MYLYDSRYNNNKRPTYVLGWHVMLLQGNIGVAIHIFV